MASSSADKFYVDALVAGQPRRLLADSGADVCILGKEEAERLGLAIQRLDDPIFLSGFDGNRAGVQVVGSASSTVINERRERNGTAPISKEVTWLITTPEVEPILSKAASIGLGFLALHPGDCCLQVSAATSGWSTPLQVVATAAALVSLAALVSADGLGYGYGGPNHGVHYGPFFGGGFGHFGKRHHGGKLSGGFGYGGGPGYGYGGGYRPYDLPGYRYGGPYGSPYGYGGPNYFNYGAHPGYFSHSPLAARPRTPPQQADGTACGSTFSANGSG